MPGSASGGGCLLLGGVCQRGVPEGGVCARGGYVCARGEVVVSQHALRQTPPVNRMTDRYKNITLATTSLQPVITKRIKISRCSDFDLVTDQTHCKHFLTMQQFHQRCLNRCTGWLYQRQTLAWLCLPGSTDPYEPVDPPRCR